MSDQSSSPPSRPWSTERPGTLLHMTLYGRPEAWEDSRRVAAAVG